MREANAEYAGWEERSAARVHDAARQRALERSRRIVRAATQILKSGGLEELTVQAVLERTGLSLRAFYQRFAGKDELLLAVFEETIREAAETYRAQIAEIEDPLERLWFIVSHMFAGSRSDEIIKHSVTMSREHLRLAESRPQELRYALEPLEVLLADQLAAAMEAGQVRKADPRRLALLVHNLVSATIHRVLLGSVSEEDTERFGAELWEFCLCAIEARGEKK